MTILEELLTRRIVGSKRALSRLLGRPQNYVCETRGYFVPIDLIDIRLHLLRTEGNEDLIERVTEMILAPWRNAA